VNPRCRLLLSYAKRQRVRENNMYIPVLENRNRVPDILRGNMCLRECNFRIGVGPATRDADVEATRGAACLSGRPSSSGSGTAPLPRISPQRRAEAPSYRRRRQPSTTQHQSWERRSLTSPFNEKRDSIYTPPYAIFEGPYCLGGSASFRLCEYLGLTKTAKSIYSAQLHLD